MAYPPYNQYTSCIDAIYFNKSNQYVQATWVAVGVTTPLAAFAALVAPWCILALIPVAAAAWLLGYCQWFLHGRLICLPPPANTTIPGGSDQCAIGMVIDLLPPSGNSFPTDVDTDYSFGLAIAGVDPDEADQTTVENSVPYGFLEKNQPATLSIGVPFTGNQATDPLTGNPSWTLHCEFEGAGVRDLMLAAAIALQIGLAAFFVCMFVPGPLGLLLTILLFLLSLLTDGAGVIVGINDQASPSDVNPALGNELHSGDLLVVAGAWVYDSGHSHDSPPRGYNEIHPIKFCTPAGKFGVDWPANIGYLQANWPVALGQATSPTTIESQKQPQNQWQVHPILDGCEPVVIV
jgi:hypothetical protein